VRGPGRKRGSRGGAIGDHYAVLLGRLLGLDPLSPRAAVYGGFPATVGAAFRPPDRARPPRPTALPGSVAPARFATRVTRAIHSAFHAKRNGEARPPPVVTFMAVRFFMITASRCAGCAGVSQPCDWRSSAPPCRDWRRGIRAGIPGDSPGTRSLCHRGWPGASRNRRAFDPRRISRIASMVKPSFFHAGRGIRDGGGAAFRRSSESQPAPPGQRERGRRVGRFAWKAIRILLLLLLAQCDSQLAAQLGDDDPSRQPGP
jgi:hypothetical protein